MGLPQAKKSIRENDLTVTGVCRGGFFTAKDWKSTTTCAPSRKRTSSARQCLVLVVGGLPPGSKDLIGARQNK